MKLLFCPWCEDVRKLDYNDTHCLCGKSWGKYRSCGIKADVYGAGLVIGLDNHTLGRVLATHVVRPAENLTIGAWLMGRPSRNVTYHDAALEGRD